MTDGDEGDTPGEETNNKYSVPLLLKPQSAYELEGCSILQDSIGHNINKKDNLFLIENDILVYVTSNSVVFENLESRERSYLLSLDSGGVACIAVHPSRTMFAVAGYGHQPRIFIYSYPDKEVLKVLNEGAERGYSSIRFNTDGTKLASVSSSPDFLLTVWDWENEAINLHCKVK